MEKGGEPKYSSLYKRIYVWYCKPAGKAERYPLLLLFACCYWRTDNDFLMTRCCNCDFMRKKTGRKNAINQTYQNPQTPTNPPPFLIRGSRSLLPFVPYMFDQGPTFLQWKNRQGLFCTKYREKSLQHLCVTDWTPRCSEAVRYLSKFWSWMNLCRWITLNHRSGLTIKNPETHLYSYKLPCDGQ